MKPYFEHLEDLRGRIVRGGRRFCWHRWAIDVAEGVWRYRECSKCQRREATRLYANIVGPVDMRWVETGEWTPEPTAGDVPPPMGGLPPVDASRRTA